MAFLTTLTAGLNAAGKVAQLFGSSKSTALKGGDTYVPVNVGGLTVDGGIGENDLWAFVAILAVLAVGAVLAVKVWKG